MGRSKKLTIAVCVLAPIVSFNFGMQKEVSAQTAVITATTKISVCGNDIKEGGEECDNSDLNGKSCGTYGYDSGTLSCNIDCTFSTAACVLSDDGDDDDSDSDSTSSTTTSAQSTSQTDSTTSTVIIRYTPIIPQRLVRFDRNRDDKISGEEVIEAISGWYERWANRSDADEESIGECDVNNDFACNVIDFSIVLFYIQT